MGASTITGGLNSYSCEKALEEGDAEYKACILAGQEETTNDYLLDFRTGEGFCKGFAQAMSTASKVKCSASDLNNATLSNPYGNIASGQKENFRLINKYLIYVSDRVTSNGTGLPYRVISADLNGNNGPNEVGVDIISFAIFDNGEVLPIGDVAESRKHFIAVIKMRNILERPESSSQSVIDSMRHPATIISTTDKRPLTFKDAYCKVFGSSAAAPTYCSGYTNFGEKFKLQMEVEGTATDVEVPVTVCSQAQYNSDGTPVQKVNGQDFVAECEFNIIKPQMSRLIPISQDVYSSINNEEDIDERTGKANQIYKY